MIYITPVKTSHVSYQLKSSGLVQLIYSIKTYKMEHIKSQEKKISTKVLFMTYYHTATDNPQSNQHQV